MSGFCQATKWSDETGPVLLRQRGSHGAWWSRRGRWMSCRVRAVAIPSTTLLVRSTSWWVCSWHWGLLWGEWKIYAIISAGKVLCEQGALRARPSASKVHCGSTGTGCGQRAARLFFVLYESTTTPSTHRHVEQRIIARRPRVHPKSAVPTSEPWVYWRCGKLFEKRGTNA